MQFKKLSTSMNIRPATPEDKPQIIELLKQSLGESMIPKSEALWAWKHEENPFGASYVLVAEEEGLLIGLRAFMQWQWQWKGETFRAIRAVDTATHPAHQGKGIFKKLTLQQLDICKKEGVHFVFNTPNEKSKPGYLKMGWVEQGKMPLKFQVRNLFSLGYAKFFNKEKYAGEKGDPTPQQNWENKAIALLEQYQPADNHLVTKLSPQYIAWRYANNPLFRYNYITDHENFLLVSRIKNHGFTKELRLVDFVLLNKDTDNKRILKNIEKGVHEFCVANKVNLISFSGVQYEQYKKYFSWMGLLPVKPLGPAVTLKDINMQERFPELMQVQNWGYSLGDMELF
jgi:GNAT superfamily N-acetyltransferase